MTVSRQVLAEPDIDLAGKTWARLGDGTPLVTGAKEGKGWIVLVHTTANAEWSNLALSGLFVEMLRRIVAVSEGVAETGDAALPPLETLDGFGRLQRARADGAARSRPRRSPPSRPRRSTRRGSTAPPIRGARSTSPRRIGELKPIGELPGGVVREGFAKSPEIDVRPPLLVAALLLALVDLVIAYALARAVAAAAGARHRGAVAVCACCCRSSARADDDFVVKATSQLRLAYVRTGGRRGRRDEPRRPDGPDRDAQPAHRGRDRRADGGRYRDART